MTTEAARRYHEWAPPAEMADTVTCLWSSSGGLGDYPVLPDGCLDIIWLDGSLVVAGSDTTAKSGSAANAIGLRFRPGRAAFGLGVPPAELLNGRFPLADLWGARPARQLAERLADAPSIEAAGGLLSAAVHDRPSRLTVDDVAVAAVDLIAASDGRAPIGAVAQRVGVGERQLRARVGAAVGYGPKLFARVMRFRAALDRIQNSTTGLARVAVDAGYADQAHMTRDVRALAGSTPAELRAVSFKTPLVASGA